MTPPETGDLDVATMLLAVDTLLAEPEIPVHEPRYAPWYRKQDYPKPEPGKIITKARSLEAEYAPLRSRIAEDLKIARMDLAGVLKGFDREEEETFPDSAIAGEVELSAAQLADAELSFDAPARRRADEDESAKKVDFLLAAREQAKRFHALAGRGPLAMEEARSLLLTGRLAWHCCLNLDADEDEIPLVSVLLDPTTCYPVFESHRGLAMMIRVYATTVGEAIGSYENAEHKLRATYLDADASAYQSKHRNEDETCEIIEYWDRRWRAVFMDGQLILGPAAHNYGFVPFIYKLGPIGLPGMMRDPQNTGDTASATTITTHRHDSSMANKGLSLVGLLKQPHRTYEGVMSLMLTALKREVKPAYVQELDEMTYPDGPSEFSDVSGALNMVKMNRQSKPEPVPAAISSAAASPILNAAVENMSRMIQPASASGQNDRSNVSGFATNAEAESGRIKLVGWKQTLEEFHAECGEMQLRLLRDWGHELAQGRGPYGEFVIPRFDASMHEDQSSLLTPDDIDRTGLRVRASLSTISLGQLGGVANAVTILKNAGVMDDIRIMRLIGDPNPYRTQSRIRANSVINDQDLIDAQAIRGLEDEGLTWEAQYLHWKKTQAGNPPQLGAGPVSPGPPGTQAIGDSLPALGMPPGPGSGPPPVLADPFGG